MRNNAHKRTYVRTSVTVILIIRTTHAPMHMHAINIGTRIIHCVRTYVNSAHECARTRVYTCAYDHR